MKQSVQIALSQTGELLRAVDWTRYEQALFISKNVWTAAVSYADAHGLSCRHILFTPLEDTFAHPMRGAIAFHGTADPWADTGRIRKLCEASDSHLYITENANHSLETGDIEQDIRNLEAVMRRVKAFMLAEAQESRRNDI